MDNDVDSRLAFVQRRLPWLIGAAMLTLYLVTLSWWISFSGLPMLSKVLDWDWRLNYTSPLHFLLTYPVRWLPLGWQVFAVNVFAAVCSALSLVLLARSVALLPHDRTRDQRALERSEFSCLSLPSAWVPPLLAVLVCGLQLTFWENATVYLGESLDLLLFAYCARCLLEYRFDPRESWLLRMAVVYGVAVTNNYAMIAFWPLFVAAMIWILRRRILNFRLILKLFGCGLAGLSLYLLLPAINSFSSLANQDFFEMLRTHWSFQRNTLLDFPRFLILLLGLTSLLPVLFIGIRWPAQYGDISAAGNLLANLTMHITHGLFLGACVYVAFDPPFSPRKLGMGWAFLPLYYLGALTVGYCSGYFLLMFSAVQAKPWQRPSVITKFLRKSMVAGVWALLVAVPAALIYRNLPEVQSGHSPALGEFGVHAARCLPPQGAVVLSDDPYRLHSLRAALTRAGSLGKYVLLESDALVQGQYHRYLRYRYPAVWSKLIPPGATIPDQIDAANLVAMLVSMQQSQPVYYLHPSFGYYFERFQLRPRRLVYELLPAPADTAESPVLTDQEVADNDQYWRQLIGGELAPLIKSVQPPPGKSEAPFAPSMVGNIYSRALNYLGVELQRRGDLGKAAEYFARALALNTNNPAAFINLDYNRLLQAGKRDNPRPTPGAVARLGMYSGSLERVMAFGGPLDEPNTCWDIGRRYIASRNYRQAAQNLQRVVFFSPERYDARLELAGVYNLMRLGDKALEELVAIRSHPTLRTNVDADPVPVILAEAVAYSAKNDMDTAFKILHGAAEKYPLNPGPFYTEVQLCLAQQQPTNAVAVLERQVRVQTNNAGAFINLGAMLINIKDPAAAVPRLNRALELSPQNQLALLNRAIAHLQTGNLDAAERDYKNLLAILPRPEHYVLFGLGEIAYKRKDAREATRLYEQYLKIAPPGLPEVRTIRERLVRLQSGSF